MEETDGVVVTRGRKESSVLVVVESKSATSDEHSRLIPAHKPVISAKSLSLCPGQFRSVIRNVMVEPPPPPPPLSPPHGFPPRSAWCSRHGRHFINDGPRFVRC